MKSIPLAGLSFLAVITTDSPKTLLCRPFCKPLGRLNPIKRVLRTQKHESFVTER